MSFWSACIFLFLGHFNLTVIGYDNMLMIHAAAGAAYVLNRYVTGDF
jgi:hypothetical protein